VQAASAIAAGKRAIATRREHSGLVLISATAWSLDPQGGLRHVYDSAPQLEHLGE